MAMRPETMDTAKKLAGAMLLLAGAVIEIFWPGHTHQAATLGTVGGTLFGMGVHSSRGKVAEDFVRGALGSEGIERMRSTPPETPRARRRRNGRDG